MNQFKKPDAKSYVYQCVRRSLDVSQFEYYPYIEFKPERMFAWNR